MSIVAKKIMMGSGAVALPSDDEFNRVSFLSHFEGANNGVNSQFTDGSASNHTITANGDVTQGSFGPFARPDGEWGVSFDGSGDYFEVSNPTSSAFGTGNFTLECWVYMEVDNTNKAIVETRASDLSANGFVFAIESDGDRKLMVYSNAKLFTTSNAISLNTWTHIAISRSGTTLKCFINGTQGASVTNSQDYTNALVRVGRGIYASSDFNGLISNLRLVNSAVYTSNFTPPTAALTAITNTKLLACQSNRFVDNSASALTITPVGNPAISAFGPFLTSKVYKVGTNGASAYFDGNGDYVHTPESAYSNTGSFTVEAWVYTTVTDTGTERRQHIISQQKDNDASRSNFNLHIVYATQIVFVVFSAAGDKSADVSSNTGLSPNTWTHIAGSFDGSNLRLFVNGVLKDTTASTNAPRDTTQPVAVGARTTNNGGTAGTEFFQGYISDARLTKSAVYTSAFTPPTAPLTAITNTQLLLNMADGQVFDSAAQNNLTLYGNAKISTGQDKFGGTSLYLDGAGDYATFLHSPTNDISGAGDWTVELFWRSDDVAHDNVHEIVTKGLGLQILGDARGSLNGNIAIGLSANNSSTYFMSGSGSALSNNTWYHIAVVKYGTSYKLYLDGTADITTTSSSNVSTGTNPWTLGAFYDGSLAAKGYIDDFRISKFARYTANFSPPTEPFPDKGQ